MVPRLVREIDFPEVVLSDGNVSREKFQLNVRMTEPEICGEMVTLQQKFEVDAAQLSELEVK